MNATQNQMEPLQEETLYNPDNILIKEVDVNELLHIYGVESEVKCLNIDLYRKAMVHKSYITRKNENFKEGNVNCPKGCLPLQEQSNEKFEFLGDRVLDFVVADYLFRRYPDENEGFYSKMKVKLVNGQMLAYLNRQIGLFKWIIISKQIEENGGRDHTNIIEDALESFICAIYLDFNKITSKNKTKRGFEIAQQWIIGVIEEYVDFAELIRENKNYKDQLVKYFQHTYSCAPKVYERDVKIVNGQKIYTIFIKDSEEKTLGIGEGESRKMAEQNASYEALRYLNIL